MAFTINTNISSLQAQNYLRVTQDFQGKTINRVTSGLRLVASGDDAAGLAIANSYRSDGAVLTQGIRNANDGLSQLQTADGGINNISQLLDRARTLATQSASGAFTGDRSVLNSEFETVIQEIDRQAQAVGLNQGGQFAKSLSVFIGGGRDSNGVTATNNGSVTLDLSKSTVDSSSLGLKGVQAVGKSGTDIGSGSAATSLSSILANTANTDSLQTPGYTKFVVKGPGFDGGVEVSVNTANLGGTSDLVAKVNSAIQAAANGGTQQATALKNANISAAITTDSDGKQQLTFKSSTTAFQVAAGDKVANALLGNFEQNAAVTGSDTNAYANTAVNNTLSFKIDGGSQINVNVTQAAGTSKGQIVKDLNADSNFAAVATAHLDGNKVVIKSKETGADSSVEIVTTNLGTTLGLSGTATAASASTGADLNVRVQAAGTVNDNTNVIASDTGATATISSTTNRLVLTVGSSTERTLTLNSGTNLTKQQIADDINTKIAADGNFTGANAVTAKVVNNQIVLEADKPGADITIGTHANDVHGVLGFTDSSTTTDHTVTTSDTITLRFHGAGLTSPVDITLNATTAGTTTTGDVLTDLQTKIAASADLASAGISLSTSSAGNNLVFTNRNGQQFQVQATGDSGNILGLGSFAAGSSNAVDYSTITAGSSYSTAGLSGTASFQVSLNGGASSTNAFSADLRGGDATAGARSGAIVFEATGEIDLSGAAGTQNLVIRIDGGTNITAALGNSATTSLGDILTTINTALGVNGTATVDGSGNLVITSASKGSDSSVEIVAAGAGASDAGTLTALGLSAGSTKGANASLTNVVQQLNQSIAGDAQLVAAGIQASQAGGKLVISSANGTNFRLNSFGADTGFNTAGATFTGNEVGRAPQTSQYSSSQGADATASIAYSDRVYGSDDQTISISANDASGVKHSLAVTLQNDSTGRSQSIDQAIKTINTALQQSNDTTLNRIVAVKDQANGAESIKFISTVKGFQVAVSSNANGTGLTAPAGNQLTAATDGTGANADINTEESAQAAVAALANAVSNLGRAQAVVGRGQNQFSFAINLAQSQLTNLAAAESRIRDADLASESANLTKAQISLQAGIAALAQANSAPQQVLSLLRG